jgi:Phage integrase, N-terminal SAM-like domain
LGESDIAKFLSNLAVERRVAASTQNQALNALLFLYKAVLRRQLGMFFQPNGASLIRAREPNGGIRGSAVIDRRYSRLSLRLSIFIGGRTF